MKIIVGLGNPTSQYENTRHNLGFQVIDYLHSKWGCNPFGLKGGSLVSLNNFSGKEKFILCKPYEYMNNSGESLKKTLKILKLHFQNVLLIYDELDIVIGKYKLIKKKEEKIKHLGVRSVEQAFKDVECLKLKIGIRPNSVKCALVIRDYVMEEFETEEKSILSGIKDSCCQLIKKFIQLNEKEMEEPINYLKR